MTVQSSSSVRPACRRILATIPGQSSCPSWQATVSCRPSGCRSVRWLPERRTRTKPARCRARRRRRHWIDFKRRREARRPWRGAAAHCRARARPRCAARGSCGPGAMRPRDRARWQRREARRRKPSRAPSVRPTRARSGISESTSSLEDSTPARPPRPPRATLSGGGTWNPRQELGSRHVRRHRQRAWRPRAAPGSAPAGRLKHVVS